MDPVITRYGHVFERTSLEDCLARKPCCPLTRRPLALTGVYDFPEAREYIAQRAAMGGWVLG